MTETTFETGIFHPSTKFYRFTLLIFVALLSLGSYFAYDIVASISKDMMADLSISEATFGAFFSFYHIAAILLVLFGGIFTDKIGTRKASLIFSILILVGVILFWTAKSVPMFFAGRFLFGAGAEPLIVAQSAILARWFKNKELALSFGIALMVSRLGSLFALNTGQVFINFFGTFRAALFAAVIACVISLTANIIYVFMDKKGEKVLDLRKESIEEKIVFKDLKKFKPSFWYVTMLCVTFYSAIFPFITLAPAFFGEKWGIAAMSDRRHNFHYHLCLNDTRTICRQTRRQDRQKSYADDFWIPYHDPQPRADGAYKNLARLPHDCPWRCFCARSCSHVAVCTSYSPQGTGGDSVWSNDSRPKYRPGALSLAQRAFTDHHKGLHG